MNDIGMRYLEKQQLPQPLANDVRIAELALATGWLPSQIRKEDMRDLEIVELVKEARDKSASELKRRADERHAQKNK